ncbi:conserved hypothetical protein [Hyphomicrobiales bacterium]|nr:conserved hypothetical protein [Hyphomicrobiales bacterium]CAH1701996.1 conserved hypothetical protein [Hyphomicrobiales bacterium]CAI0346154.1 conserved hypothetical protein [Hyphomicrobiales bacterium]
MNQKAREPVPFDTAPEEREGDVPEQPLSPLEAASFIEGMAAELRLMAKATQLNALAYFLEMVRVEASGEVVRLSRTGSKPGSAGRG